MKTYLSPIISILAVASLFLAGGAIAQNQNGDKDWHRGPPSVEDKLARISEALDLNDEQSSEMLVILQEQERSKQALHNQTMEVFGAEICAQKTQAENAILGVLDNGQAELFLQLKEERQIRTNERKRSRRGPESLDCSAY